MDIENPTGGNEEFGKEKFSLGESPLNLSFCANFWAVFLKRFNSYRRAKKRIFVEMLLPSLTMVFGVYLSTIEFSPRSEERVITPSLYPLKQKLLMNKDIISQENSDLPPDVFWKNLPDAEEAFEVRELLMEPGETFDDFAEAVFSFA